MPGDAAPALPDDVASLKAMVLAQTAELTEIRAQRQAQKAELATAHSGLIEQRFEIEALKARLSKLLRLTFGRSSERLRVQVEQLELALADIDELLAETGAVDVVATEQTVAQDRKPARRPLPERLPRDVVEHAAPCRQTGACLAAPLRPLGEDVTEILDYVPGTFRVIRHVRPKLSCRAARQLPRPLHQVCRFAVAGPVRDCWRMCWWRNTATICRCIARRRSMRARTSTSADRRWPTWLARSRGWCGP